MYPLPPLLMLVLVKMPLKAALVYSAENLAVIRHVGINLRSRDKKTKVGVKTKRLKAGWDDNYLKTVLSALNIVTS
jgi:hypothetical protein